MPDFGRKLEEHRKTEIREIHSSDIIPGQIKQRHLEANLFAVKFGLAANRPTSPGTNSQFRAYFATDTGALSMWDGTQW